MKKDNSTSETSVKASGKASGATSGFEKTNWSKEDYVLDYLKNVEAIIPVRARVTETLKSLYLKLLKTKNGSRLIELGSGDGYFSEALLSIDPTLKVTLIDASPTMLDKARLRLTGFKNVEFVLASFEDIIEHKIKLPQADLIFSALAIHHLATEKRGQFFSCLHELLNTNGWFVNFDISRSPTEELEQWYQRLWDKRMQEKEAELKIKIDRDFYIGKHKERDHMIRLNTLTEQFDMLGKAGFVDMDCFYKFAIFSIYGAKKGALS
jgi:tRNA (cmo5U34)-methyltransferase